MSSTVPHRCKGWLRACALQPTSQRPQTSRWRGPQAWDPHGPCPTQGLEWTVQLVLLRTRGPGSAGGGSELKFRVSATGHSVCGLLGNLVSSSRLSAWVWAGLPRPLLWDTWVSLANQSAAPPCPGCDRPRPRSLYWGLFLSALRASHLGDEPAAPGGLPLGLGGGPACRSGQISAVQFGLLDQAVPEEDLSTQTSRVCQSGLDADTCC